MVANSNTHLITEIYAAAVSPKVWSSAIDFCVEHVGAKTAALISVDSLGVSNYQINALSGVYRDGLTEADLNYWLTELAPYDELGHHYALTQPAKSVFRDIDVNSDVEALDKQPDFVFLREKFGVRRKLSARLLENKRYTTNIGFQFSEEHEIIAISSIKAMNDILPHIAKSVEMGILYNRLQTKYSAVLSALNHVGIGLCVVDTKGNVIVENSEAARIFDAGLGIYRKLNKTIAFESNEAALQFQRIIVEATIGKSKNCCVAESILSVKSKDHTHPLIIEVCPLRDHDNEIDIQDDAVLVQMIDIACHRHCTADAFIAAYGLTKAEGEVAKLLVEGKTNREISDVRNTMLETTKSQIKSLLQKANVQSRIHLIRLILKTDPPILDHPIV